MSDKKGQVNQRQYGYKFAKTDYLMHLDDDTFITIKNLKILLNQFQNLPRKSSIAPRLIMKNDVNKELFLKNLKIYCFIINLNLRLELYQNLLLKFRIISPLIQIIESVDWIPGGISII